MYTLQQLVLGFLYKLQHVFLVVAAVRCIFRDEFLDKFVRFVFDDFFARIRRVDFQKLLQIIRAILVDIEKIG
jgi:hypothetical protein